MSWFVLPGPAACWASVAGLQVALKSGGTGGSASGSPGSPMVPGGQLAEDGTLTRLVEETSTTPRIPGHLVLADQVLEVGGVGARGDGRAVGEDEVPAPIRRCSLPAAAMIVPLLRASATAT